MFITIIYCYYLGLLFITIVYYWLIVYDYYLLALSIINYYGCLWLLFITILYYWLLLSFIINRLFMIIIIIYYQIITMISYWLLPLFIIQLLWSLLVNY